MLFSVCVWGSRVVCLQNSNLAVKAENFEMKFNSKPNSRNTQFSVQERIRCYIHDRDSEIGTEKYTELCQAVEDSRKLVIILSNSYLANPSCLNEANLLAGKSTQIVHLPPSD